MLQYEESPAGWMVSWDAIRLVKYRGVSWVWEKFFVSHDTSPIVAFLRDSDGEVKSTFISNLLPYGLHDTDPTVTVFSILMKGYVHYVDETSAPNA